MNSDTNDLVDFAILPQSRVQSYETTIDEQKEAIEKLKAEIENLEKSNQLPVEDKKSQICDTEVSPSNSVDDEKVKDEEQPSISPPAAKVTETFPEDKGHNFRNPKETESKGKKRKKSQKSTYRDKERKTQEKE